MPGDAPSAPPNPWAVMIFFYAILIVGVLMLEASSSRALAQQAAAGGASTQVHGAAILNAYLRMRATALGKALPLTVFAFFIPMLLYFGAKRLSAVLARWRAKDAKMEFRQEPYEFPRVATFDPVSPPPPSDRPIQVLDRTMADFIAANDEPSKKVFLGIRQDGSPYYLTDAARATHVHIMGQTGSGKTKSVLEPLLFQDMWRGRGAMLVDAKGSQENEERFAAMAASVGRLDEVKVFTLSPGRLSHTYNLLHMPADARPQAVAERVFSGFSHEMDEPYYRGQANRFFTSLVKALAGTGKPFHMMDAAAATASPEILDYALQLSSDKAAKADIYVQLKQLGNKAGQALTGLLEALMRYDHPSLNVYDPDIVLEDIADRQGLVGFFLPVNYYKVLARNVGITIFQHLQQIGSLRQMDKERPQTPFAVFADEFYNFAYEGFTTAVNMLRDAKISIHIAHQSLSDLEKESKEFAAGIWDNTRTKIVLLQTNPVMCELLAKTLGTKKDIEMTLRRSADAFNNMTNMQEASTKEVDAYRLHPTRVKMLQTGQGYVTQDAEFVALNLQFLPNLPVVKVPPPKKPVVQGLGLHRMLSEGLPAPSYDDEAP